MSRDYYDRTADEWRAALDTVRKAAGDCITLPVGHLALIFHGYEQYRQERAKTLAWIESAESSGYLDNTAAAHARHALGEISDEQLADEVRAATHRQEGS